MDYDNIALDNKLYFNTVLGLNYKINIIKYIL